MFDSLSQRFASDADVLFSYLFGSQATGRVSPQSDVDLAVYLRPEVTDRAADKQMALLAAATEILSRNDVDLIVLNDAPPELAYRVLRDGRLLSCRDGLALVRFRVRALNAYFDQQPMRDTFYQYLVGRVKEGRYGD